MGSRIVYYDLINDTCEVVCTDEPSAHGGGACHDYEIRDKATGELLMKMEFAKGPAQDRERNGISDKALLCILIDRMQHFQNGPFSSRETAVTLTKLEEAAMWQTKRDRMRERRGVKGKNEK